MKLVARYILRLMAAVIATSTATSVNAQTACETIHPSGQGAYQQGISIFDSMHQAVEKSGFKQPNADQVLLTIMKTDPDFEKYKASYLYGYAVEKEFVDKDTTRAIKSYIAASDIDFHYALLTAMLFAGEGRFSAAQTVLKHGLEFHKEDEAQAALGMELKKVGECQ